MVVIVGFEGGSRGSFGIMSGFVFLFSVDKFWKEFSNVFLGIFCVFFNFIDFINTVIFIVFFKFLGSLINFFMGDVGNDLLLRLFVFRESKVG